MAAFAEVGRIPAVAGANILSELTPAGFCSLSVENALSAPVYIAWGGGPSGPGAYDAVVAGSSIRTIPVPPYATKLQAQVAYPGAVPASDAGLYCIVSATSANLGSTSGPIA